jgi:23S rRNA (adenine2503-C2)-methyltransferase
MSTGQKRNIRNQSLDDLGEFFKQRGEPAYRASQVYNWVWKKAVRSFHEMTDLSKKTRECLEEDFTFNPVQIHASQRSRDGTMKLSFKLYDNHLVEGVLIPAGDRTTACISSQVGCNLACKFCATGMIRYMRNLNFDEIFDQVSLLNELSLEKYEKSLSNIVYMGMGEPLLNYHNVLKSVERITASDGPGMSPQRITISTVGIAPMIRQLGKDKVKFNLAISLHSAINDKRNEIIPYNLRNSLDDLSDAVKFFYSQTRTRITIEYLMLKGFNDTQEDAKALADFCRSFPVKVNLIQYNPVENSPFKDSGVERTRTFKEYLERLNMVVNIRRSRGKDIDAACGQLANKLLRKNS